MTDTDTDVQTVGEVARWSKEIEIYDRQSQKWVDKSKKIIKRYKDERNNADEGDSRFNMLWSNIQTLSPALFAKNPKANVERRYHDDDDIGRFASMVLERCVSYYIDERFFDVTQECVLDRLLPGRGVMWVRYVPTFGADGEELTNEEIVNDYVHWQDFGHTWARTPEEIKAVWRKVYMDRKELIERFPEYGARINLDYSPAKLDDEKISEEEKKATIYEIWNKTTKTVFWIHKDFPEVLDSKKDPLRLKDFWPLPRPMFATLGNDSCIPVPDYQEYQDQADELDDLTGRMNMLQKALKIVGVYDSSKPGIERILSEGVDNQLLPVDQWAMLGEKGLEGVISWLPIEKVIEGLKVLYELRAKVKEDAYEISGMSDIIRGQGDANETATGVKTKGQFATLRLSAMQAQVSRFCRDAVRIMAEIIATHYSLDTIKAISGVKLLMAQEKKLIEYVMKMQEQQHAPQPGQPPMPPPLLPPEIQKLMSEPEKLDEMMQNPTWEEVYGLLKNDLLRCFRIDIETDSTIKADQEAERQDRVQFLEAAGGFIQQAATVQDPDLQPLLAQMLMFGVRGFHAGKDLETAFEIYIKKVEQKSNNPQPPPADPKIQLEQQKLAMQQQQAQAEMQHTEAQGQRDAALEQQRLQADQQLQAQKYSQDRDLQQQKLSHEQTKESVKAALAIESMKHQAQMQGATQGHEHAHVQEMQEQQHAHEKSMPKPKGKE